MSRRDHEQEERALVERAEAVDAWASATTAPALRRLLWRFRVAKYRRRILYVMVGVIALLGARSAIPAGVIWIVSPIDSSLLVPGDVSPVLLELRHETAVQRVSSPVSTVSARIITPTRWDWYLHLRKTHPEHVPPQPEGIPETLLADGAAKGTSFADSKVISIVAASRLAGMPVTVTGDGVVVWEYAGDSAFANSLNIGDVIVGANSKPVRSYADLELIANSVRKSGGKLSLAVRGGQSVVDSRGVLGIGAHTVAPEFTVTPPISIVNQQYEKTEGGSAGLAYALAAYIEMKTLRIPESLRVAATGVIHDNGSVSRIDALRQKVEAAQEAGIDVLFVPIDNEFDALELRKTTSAQIVPVATLKEAVAELKKRNR